MIRTDASVKSSQGAGISYEAVIYDEQGRYSRERGSSYIPKEIKTTDAETIAAAFGVMEIYEIMGEEKGEYEVILESDCQPTVNSIHQSIHEDTEVERVLKFFARSFGEFRSRWIPRVKNSRADAIAREARRRGWENNDSMA